MPLVYLQETGGGLSQKELALLVGVDGSSLVRVLDILCRQGLAERRPDANDGRARLVHLTEAGKERVAGIRAELIRAEEEILADLTDQELALTLEQFEKIDARLSALQAATQKDTSR